MSTTNNPKLIAGFTPEATGVLYDDRQITDAADPNNWPATIASGDFIQIGVVPAGCVLVGDLSRITVPQLDSGGSGTGHISIGTLASAAAILAATDATAAFTKGPGALLNTTVIGDPINDTPIYAKATAAFVTFVQTGKIVFDVVCRAWRDGIDG